MPDKLGKADVFIFISSCAVFVDHILQGKQKLLIICYMLYSQLASPDGSLDLEIQKYWVRIPVGSDVCHWGSASTIIQTAQSPGMCSAAYGTMYYTMLKHTTTLFSLSDHDIQSREWRVIAHQVYTNHHGRSIVL